MKLPKLIVCGPARRMTREQIKADDAAFLEKMRGGRRSTQSAIELVRAGRSTARS